MRRPFLFVALAAFLLVLLFSVCARAASFFDDFNRADSSNLGPNWTIVQGSIGISGDRATSSGDGQNPEGYAIVNGFSGSYLTTEVSLDVAATTGLSYAALLLGYNSANGACLFVKVQGRNGVYDHVAFYYGNNNDDMPPAGGNYFSITPFTAGEISIYAIGADTIKLSIDSNFDGVSDQAYTFSYSSTQIASLGGGVGFGTWDKCGAVYADNFSASSGRGSAAPVPLPGALSFFGPGLAVLAAVKRTLTAVTSSRIS